MNASQPFVGVCGIRSGSDFTKLLNMAPEMLKGTDRFIMAGVENVTDEIIIPDKYSAVRPFVHCDFNGREPFGQIVERNIRKSSHFVRGLQLNVLPWMDTDYAPLFNKLKSQYPDISLMLQAHRVTMEQYTPKQIAGRAGRLPIDYILFDLSQGRGAAYELQSMRRYVDEAYKVRPNLAVAVAGGLGGPSMDNLFSPLVRTYPALSCDAFGQLQKPSTQTLSWPRIRAYLTAWKRSLKAAGD